MVENNNSTSSQVGLGAMGKTLLVLAALVIVLAGIKTASAVIVPFLLSILLLLFVIRLSIA